MIVRHDGVDIYCLPDGAYCKADEEQRNPLDVENCPLGYEACNGDCFYYNEK